MTAVLRGWWKALAGFLLAILGFVVFRGRKPPAPPPAGQEGVQEAAERHDGRVQVADQEMAGNLTAAPDERYRRASQWYRDRVSRKPPRSP